MQKLWQIFGKGVQCVHCCVDTKKVGGVSSTSTASSAWPESGKPTKNENNFLKDRAIGPLEFYAMYPSYLISFEILSVLQYISTYIPSFRQPAGSELTHFY